MSNKYGFLREFTYHLIETNNCLQVTGLNHYISLIFPHVNDWMHDSCIGKIIPMLGRRRPDYFSPSLNIAIEFDGIAHYTNPDIIIKDSSSYDIYKAAGVELICIPYFIQLSAEAIHNLFGVEMDNESLPDSDVVSFNIAARNTPAYMCGLGVKRYIDESYIISITQTKANNLYLYQHRDDSRSGYEFVAVNL